MYLQYLSKVEGKRNTNLNLDPAASQRIDDLYEELKGLTTEDFLKLLEERPMNDYEAVFKVYPWLRTFQENLSEACPDCAVKIGEKHNPNCDAARCSICGGQRLTCGCPEGEPDVWLGIMHLPEHKICLDKGYWCRDILKYNGKEYPITSSEMWRLAFDLQTDCVPGFRMEHHVPCKSTDPGAQADLNRAEAERKKITVDDIAKGE